MFPGKRITVNLAPADIRKAGPSYDLPIAVGVLIASEQAWPQAVEGALFVGELSLDGLVRHVTGILPIAALAHQQSMRRLFVPAADAPEAALIGGLEIVPVEHLSQLAAHLQGLRTILPYQPDQDPAALPPPLYAADFAEIKGQEHVKRALEVAAAGGHNVLMTGPPGSGKTLLARSRPSILPTMTVEEALRGTRGQGDKETRRQGEGECGPFGRLLRQAQDGPGGERADRDGTSLGFARDRPGRGDPVPTAAGHVKGTEA